MSILTQLKTLNITLDQLSELTKSGIIRIEKRLKAEVKFNDALTINEVEEVLSLLKNNRTELELLYNSYFNFFREIIESPNTLFTFSVNTPIALEFTDDFIEFISNYFDKSLELYVVNCIKESHYFALYSLLSYKDILSEYVLDFILESLRKKIKLGFETLELKPKGPYDKIDYITNPYFYRCVTEISSLSVENDVIDLLNTILNNNSLNDFYFKTLFAVGEFKSSRSETSNVIAGNKRVAIEKGVSEKQYSQDEFPKKGGTVIRSSTNNYSSSNSYSSNKSTSSSYSSNNSYSSSSSFSERENSRSSGTSVFIKVLIGIVILYKIIRIISAFGYTDESPGYQSEQPYDIEEIQEMIRKMEIAPQNIDNIVTTEDGEDLLEGITYDSPVDSETDDDTPSEEIEEEVVDVEEFESSVSLETVIIAPRKIPARNYLKFTNSLALVEKNFSVVYNSIQYFQSSRLKVLKEISTDFEMEGTHFENPIYTSDAKSKVVIVNKN